MAKIYFLGTCSGTEPMEGMHHCSWVAEIGSHVYWFDAGECCAYTAHTEGIDVLRTKALFVSHPHIDHVGGLANLFFCMNKLISRGKGYLPDGNVLPVYFPDHDLLAAIKTVALGGRGGGMKFELDERSLSDGVIYEDERLRVSALHNRHIKGDDGSRGWHSFSFLLEFEGKRLVFSGDVKHPRELDALIGDGVDMLIMETGHHDLRDVCGYAASMNVRRLRLNHHGRYILENRTEAERYVSDFSKEYCIDVKICKDKSREEL